MKQERYEVEGNQFFLFDEELGIDLQGELEFLDKETFPTGELRYETYRKEDKLHGPSFFYDKNGQLLSESWFYEGVQIGKSRRYYPTGQLYCIERYLDGVFHLSQEYFYLDHSPRSIISYDRGILHGESVLFWPDGNLKRKSVFEKGEKVSDLFYDEEGNSIGEPADALS